MEEKNINKEELLENTSPERKDSLKLNIIEEMIDKTEVIIDYSISQIRESWQLTPPEEKTDKIEVLSETSDSHIRNTKFIKTKPISFSHLAVINEINEDSKE